MEVGVLVDAPRGGTMRTRIAVLTPSAGGRDPNVGPAAF